MAKLLGYWSTIAVALFALTACRFGNHSDQPTSNIKGDYKSIELYLTEPTQLETVVLYNDSTPQSANSNTPLAAIPTSVLNTFTDPVFYAVPVDATKSPIFVNSTQTTSINTTVDKNGVIKDEHYSDVVTFWSNPNCKTQVQMFQDGSFDHQNGVGTVITFPDQSKAKASGRLKVDFTYIRVISGDCSADLNYLAQCYKTGSGCTHDELAAANGLFDLFVSRGAVLNLNDVAKIKALAYIVHFQ